MPSAALDPAAVREFEAVLAPDQLITGPEQLRTYECDGLTNRRVIPALVALPQSTAEVAAVVAICHAHDIPFVARGAG